MGDKDRPRIGLMLPTREAMLVEGSGSAAPGPAALIGRAVEAEEAGLDSVWVGDSLLARPRLEALSMLSAVAARTERVTLGTAVLLPALRHPVLLAYSLATLDQLADGRLIVGVGAGFPYPPTEAEFEAVGVRFDKRVGILNETVDICRRLWRADGPLSYEGKHFSLAEVDLLPKPAQSGGPPFWLAGATPAALRRAGRLYDGWLPYPPSSEGFMDGRAGVDAAAAEFGREASEITGAMYATIALDGEPERARTTLEDYVDAYYGFPLEVMSQMQAFYGGDAAGCVEWLQRYVDAGVEHIILRLGTLGDARTTLDLLATEVLPELRRTAPADPPSRRAVSLVGGRASTHGAAPPQS